MRTRKMEILTYIQVEYTPIYSAEIEYIILMCSNLLMDTKVLQKKDGELYHTMDYLHVTKFKGTLHSNKKHF